MTKPLDFDDLKSILHRRIDQLPDHRKPEPNTRYTIKDAARVLAIPLGLI